MLMLSAVLVAACSVPTVDIPVDSDQDGLLDHEEEALGTDPYNPDSDGDGWLDGVEVSSYTDPLDPDDHPYQGGWPIGPCRHDIVGTGWYAGATAHGFTRDDQYGDPVKLHDFCDVPVVLTFFDYG